MSLFYRFISTYVYVCHVCVGAHRDHKVSELLELELGRGYCKPPDPGGELTSAHAINHQAISPGAPQLFLEGAGHKTQGRYFTIQHAI